MPKTVLMIGAGAVKGGWEAVFVALRRLYPGLQRDGCNLAFANLVHRLRWLAHAAQREPDTSSAFYNQRANYEKLKEAIAEELQRAFEKGQLSLGDYGKELIQKLRNESPDLKVITTNWDKTLDAFLESLGAIGEMGRLYLHGIATSPSTLYLPTEAVDEVYRDESTEREARTWRNAHLLGIKWIANCDRLFVYGLSFSPLDPELGMVTVAGFHERKRPCDVEVHDPQPEPVVANLRFYCDSPLCRSIRPITIPDLRNGPEGTLGPVGSAR